MSKLPFTIHRDATFRRLDDMYFSTDAPRYAPGKMNDAFAASDGWDLAINCALVLTWGGIMFCVGYFVALSLN